VTEAFSMASNGLPGFGAYSSAKCSSIQRGTLSLSVMEFLFENMIEI